MSGNNILSPLDVERLQNQGLLGRRSEKGTRRLHKRRLNRSSDEENIDIPLDVHVEAPAFANAFATIPDQLISRATLEYVGFSEAKALELWNQWTNWPSQGPARETDLDASGLRMKFEMFFTGAFHAVSDTCSSDDQQWRQTMDSFGLSISVQQAILDPNFRRLRLTQSCAYWAKDTTLMRYAGLKDIQLESMARGLALMQVSGTNVPSSGSGIPSASSNLPSSPSHRRLPSTSSAQQQSHSSVSMPSANSVAAIAARNAPGYTILYKGVDKARIDGLLHPDGTIDRIQVLLSSAPSDFSGRHALYYFTPNYAVAEYYACYAKRRANVESVVVVTLAIPNPAIESLQSPEILRLFWPSPEWKRLIWECRQGSKIPKELRKYMEATLIIGTISRKPNDDYALLSSWKQVTEDFILKFKQPNGQISTAVQYVFGDEGEDFLITHGRFKVFPYTRSNLDTWIEEGGPSTIA